MALGQFLNITVNVVFPYVVLGALFGASSGGQALIKFAIIITRKLRVGQLMRQLSDQQHLGQFPEVQSSTFWELAH